MPNKKNLIRKAKRTAPDSKLYKGAYKGSRQMNEAKVGGGFAFDDVEPKRAPRAIEVKKAPRATEVKKAANSVKKKKVKKTKRSIEGYKNPEDGSGSYQG